jgi:hypothetical protein
MPFAFLSAAGGYCVVPVKEQGASKTRLIAVGEKGHEVSGRELTGEDVKCDDPVCGRK